MTSYFVLKKFTLPSQFVRTHRQAVLEESLEPVIKVNQLTPRWNTLPQGECFTVIAAGGSGGLVKEVYEPLLERITEVCRKRKCYVGSIFMADETFTGESAQANKNVNGNEPSWLDHSRDLLFMVNILRQHITMPIFGVGHSVGGAHLLGLSLLHPQLLSAMALIEPYPYPNLTHGLKFHLGYGRTISRRREVWPSREAAIESIRKHPYYQGWNEAALDKLLMHGFVPEDVSALTLDHDLSTSPGPVRAITPVHWDLTNLGQPNINNNGELASLSSPACPDPENHPDRDPLYSARPFYHPAISWLWKMLPHVRPAVLYVEGSLSHAKQSTTSSDEKVNRTGTGVGGSGGVPFNRVKRYIVAEGQHSIPVDEHMEETADVIGAFLADELQRWQKTTTEAKASAWNRSSVAEKQKTHPALWQMFHDYDGEKFSDVDEALMRKAKL